MSMNKTNRSFLRNCSVLFSIVPPIGIGGYHIGHPYWILSPISTMCPIYRAVSTKSIANTVQPSGSVLSEKPNL